MFMAVEGHFNGEKIVLNENINLTSGQKVMVIVLPEKTIKKKAFRCLVWVGLLKPTQKFYRIISMRL